MAEKIMLDTSVLVDAGKTQAEFEAEDGWDPAIYGVVDSGQTFDIPIRDIWFYFPTINEFFISTPKFHAVLRACKTLFTSSRWDEIRACLDEQGSIDYLLGCLDMISIRTKMIRARDKSLITTPELEAMETMVAHLPS